MEHYTVEQTIGHGNYGQIFQVRHKENCQIYVCKKIDLSSKTASQRKEAENEVRTMSKLHHPNIVGFIEAFIESDTLHIIMEYCDGQDLEKTLLQHCKAKTVIPEAKIIHIVAQIALGLRTLHSQHLLHRDLKSANVFLTSSGGVKLGDFGFSKQLNYTMALANTVCGTPYYFAPELCQRLPYSNKADVWSLGVILYEMINLRKPFEAKSLKELRVRVVGEKPAPFAATHVSDELKELCMLMFRKNSASRPSVDQLLNLPILKAALGKLCAQMTDKEAAAHRQAAEIQEQHRKEGDDKESPRDRRDSGPPAGFEGGKFDAATMRAVLASKNAGVAPPVPTPPKQPKDETVQLHSRVPNARDTISKKAPPSAVHDLHKNIIEEENARMLKAEATEILSPQRERRPSLGIPPEDLHDSTAAAAMGEAQDDMEKRLRDLLGDAKFMKAVELFFLISEATTDAQRDKTKHELLALLGDKQYLLPDIEKVSLLFELA